MMFSEGFMSIRRILFTTGLIILGVWPLFSAVKQVRVIAERAIIYIEPSRTSARIEIVGKGTILNLLQERKVKDIWYYVSFNSPRYGTRISGFIQESAVEPAVETPTAPPKQEPKIPPKVEPEQARPHEVLPPPKVELKEEKPAKIPSAPETVEAIALTKLPKSKSYKFPRVASLPLETAWQIVEIAPAPVKEKKPPVEVREYAVMTVPPKRRPVALPKKESLLDDPAWQIVQPVIAARPKPVEKVKAEPKPPEVKKAPPEKKPVPKPAQPQPVRPVKPAPVYLPRKGPGFITFGLGYGSSFGGAGGCLQLNSRTGLSLHAGVGIYPASLIYSETDWVKNTMMWSVGLKYYLPLQSLFFSPFVDIQFGGLRVEAAQVVIGIWDYKYILSREQKSLWGPSLLAGVELRKGRFGISAALGISYATTSWDYLKNKLSFVFDTGLLFHF
jgi:hypothetical protein